MVQDALSEWVNWLLAFVLPPSVTGKTPTAEVWERGERSMRSNVEHSDPVLAELISQESRGVSWAVSVHLCVCSMAEAHRLALFGESMGFTQAVIAEKIGIRQQRVSDVLIQAKRLLAIDLESRKHVLQSQRNALKRGSDDNQ
ncbi:MAG: hypothetical protein EPN60_16910 [Nevskiaceae bacterium]|nr:MAG: hypothetical protein EPN60_16910 [Nevskiaceae bacterium]